MSRDIGSLNVAQASAASLESVLLVSFAFDTPVYVHSGIGNIVYNGNTYTGVGYLGEVGGIEESERLSPAAVTFGLAGVVSSHITEALDAGNYGDRITSFVGYRSADGTLVEDPWSLGAGSYEFSDIELGGKKNRVLVTMQHDIGRLEEKSGRRYSDEDQQNEYAADEGFSFVHSVAGQRLLWGGQVVAHVGGVGGGGGGASDDE